MTLFFNPLSAIVIFLGSLVLSGITDDARFFILGYPIAMMTMGIADWKRTIGKFTFYLGTFLLLIVMIMKATQ